MRIYTIKEYPRCRYCKERLNFFIIGLPSEKHAHPECEGKAMADETLRRIATLLDVDNKAIHAVEG
jgi:hypothetical protein